MDYPRVTEILNYFRFTDFSKVNPHVMELAQNFGKVVHKTCQLDDEKNLGGYDPKIEPYLNAWRKFKEDYKPKFFLIEQRLISNKWFYMGTPDRGFTVKKRNFLIDIKTGADYPATELQLGGYETLVLENYKKIKKIHERFTVKLEPDKYKIIPHEDKTSAFVFIGLVRAWWWKKNRGIL